MTDEQVVPRNVSLYPNDWAVVNQVAKDTGQRSYSGALRYIITDWTRRVKRQPVPIVEATPEQAAQILEALGIEDVGSFAAEVAKLQRTPAPQPETAAG